MVESIQHTLDRVRKPRVHITYDVEIGGAIQMKELPFVVGILADLSGMPEDELPKLKERKFINIDRDNIIDFMVSINPRLAIETKNTLNDGEESFAAELFFKNLDDFGPIRIAQQSEKLNNIYQKRIKLHDLLAKTEGNDPLQHKLINLVQDAKRRASIKDIIAKILNPNAATADAAPANTPPADAPPLATDAATPPSANATPTDAATPPPAADETPPADATPAPPPADAAPLAPDENMIFLEEMFTKGKLAREEPARPYACELLMTFITIIDENNITELHVPIALLEKQIAIIDDILSTQINEILHHPQFQMLEGLWRALFYLIMNTETGERLKIKILNVTKTELLDDLEKAVEFDQSALFKKVYEEEYGTFGGHPYSCLIGSYEFTRHPQDMMLLEKIAGVAAAAHAPFIAAANPRLFDMDTFAHLSEPRDLAKIFESTEMVKWRSLRNIEDSRYLTLTVPKVLMRLPYGPDTLPVAGINYIEKLYGSDSAKFCWGSAAFVLAQRITNAVSHYNWPAAIRGVEGGGIVEGLPAYTFKTTDGEVALKCPTEIAITDRREKELSDMGFLALCHSKGTDFAAFFGGQTVQKPKVYNTNEANSNAQLSTKLPYILAASRFAHYIKAIMRDKIGSFTTKEEVAAFLNNWIANYVLLNDSASQDLKASYPLREARVDVFDVPGKPGSYKATIFLRPHFQLEELTASIRLVATLPPPAA